MNFSSGGQLPASSPPGDNAASESSRPDERRVAWTIAGLLGLALVWSYWTTFQGMIESWWTNPQYSHGFLVPCFAAVVLWYRREQLTTMRWTPNLWGLPLLVGGLGLRIFGIDIVSIDAFSLLPTLAGLVLFVGGWGLLAWSWPAIAFLAFMLPLPFTVDMALANPLRRIATVGSTYLLQTMGFPALHEGNIIVIDQIRLGVIEACSGLGMLMTFFALATAFVLVMPAPRVDRIVLLVSAIPIAVVANVVRITITGMAHYWFGAAVGDKVHDLAGWFIMMPLALLLFWCELWFLERLFRPVAQVENRPMALWGALSAPSKEGSPVGPSA